VNTVRGAVSAVVNHPVVSAIIVGLALPAMGRADDPAALPADYSTIGTDATATFGWAKGFAIGVVTFCMVLGLIKLARKK
jgi:hypothetical protein